MDTSMERSAFATRVDANAVTNEVDSRVVVLTQPSSAAAEQYRMLYHRIERLRSVRPLKSLALTSALSGEGKTLTAVNLALTAAQSNPGRKVLLLDCDLRRPKVHDYLGFRATPGLSDVLAEETTLPEAVRRFSTTKLAVLPAGKTVEEPTTLLHSPRMRQLLDLLNQHFDEMYLDAPPCLPFADAHVLATQCQGVLMVVKAGATSQRHIAQALEHLHDAPMIGCVLNEVEMTDLSYR